MQCLEDYKVIIPELNNQVDQDEEWFHIKIGDRQKKIRFHDYAEIYNIPGLYERIFYEFLKCKSPQVVSNLLFETIREFGDKIENLRVLDFGAGNGMVGEQIEKRGCDLLVGIDILEEAMNAALRDRPNAYDQYYITDMNNPNDIQLEKLEMHRFNVLISIAALGFGDISPRAFINAFNLVSDSGWVAFNIKDRFLTENDDTGYKEIIEHLIMEHITEVQSKLYCHRLSITGEELYYVAVVGKKIKNFNLSETENLRMKITDLVKCESK